MSDRDCISKHDLLKFENVHDDAGDAINKGNSMQVHRNGKEKKVFVTCPTSRAGYLRLLEDSFFSMVTSSSPTLSLFPIRVVHNNPSSVVASTEVPISPFALEPFAPGYA